MAETPGGETRPDKTGYETRPNTTRYETTALNGGGFEEKGGYPGGRRPPNATPKPPTPAAFTTPVQKPQASDPPPQ